MRELAREARMEVADERDLFDPDLHTCHARLRTSGSVRRSLSLVKLSALLLQWHAHGLRQSEDGL